MDSNRTLGMGGRTASRRREVGERVAIVVAAILLVAGVVVFVQSRSNTGPAPTAAPAGSQTSKPQPVAKPGGKLDPAARTVATQFIRDGLARENLARAWSNATPDLRSAVTKKQWLNGELPFPPFPVTRLETSGLDVVATAPRKVLLEILLVPKLNSGYAPTRYALTLVRSGNRSPWKVSYFMPYAPPGEYKEPQ